MREPNAVDNFLRVNKAGYLEPVWWRREVLPFMLYPDLLGNNAITIPANTAAPNTVSYKLPHASISMDAALGNPLLINMVTCGQGHATPEFTVQLFDMGDQTQFMNAPIHIRTFAGNGQLAARLTEPLFLPTRHNLLATFSATPLGGADTARMFLGGQLYCTWATDLQKYPSDWIEMQKHVNYWLERRKFIFPFWLTTDAGGFVIPLSGQTVDFNMSVGSDGHFESSHILASLDNTDDSLRDFTVQFFNPQTRQAIMNGSVHGTMLGSALYPQAFPAKMLVPAGQYITVRVTAGANSAGKTIYLTLRGRKLRAPITTAAKAKSQIASGNPKDVAPNSNLLQRPNGLAVPV